MATDKAGGILIPTSGEPLVLIPLSNRRAMPGASISYAIVNADDYHLVSGHKWFAYWNPTAASFYARTTTPRVPRKRTLSMHRFILNLDQCPAVKVDHRNTTTLDNRRVNLRLSSVAQNGFNRTKQRNNSSGFKGVVARGSKWTAEIKAHGVRVRLGRFTTAQAAASAYDDAARRLHGEFARTNAS